MPTVGRARLVRSLIESLVRCNPRADEILIVDQSEDDQVEHVVGEFADLGARVLHCDGRGEGLGRNVGLREARHEVVLGTDDDCTVASDWVGRAWAHVQAQPGAIVTGRVLPVGDPRAVPSTRDDPEPRDYTGDLSCFPLFPNNMALDRSIALELGGFDEGLPAAPDNDFCYRWLRAGNRLVYEPDMVVWHHDWRSPEQLERLYARYARGQGAFYAKHLRSGDLRMLRFIARDVYGGLRSLAAAALRGRPRWSDPRRGFVTGLPVGLGVGWRAYKSGRDSVALLSQLGGVEPREGGGPPPSDGREVVAFSPTELEEIRRTRRHPRPTQFDYLHIRSLVRDLTTVLGGLKHPAHDVLDLFCGARPYDDLLPPGARVVGLDIEGNPYGVADVVTDDFLPFPDQSFDLVLCTQAFDYVPDPRRGVAEIRRVLRPGRTVVITVPLVWEYERDVLVHRFTGPELAALFEGWRDVEVVESGGRAVSWATVTGSLVNMAEWHVPQGLRLRSVLRPAFGGAYLLISGIGLILDRAERRFARSSLTLPMNLLVTARRPDRDDA